MAERDPFAKSILKPSRSDYDASVAARLWEACRARVGKANLEAKEKRVGTGLGKYERLVAALPSLAAFRPLRFDNLFRVQNVLVLF